MLIVHNAASVPWSAGMVLMNSVMGFFLSARQAGNIAEAVVWECGASERHLIADRALAYALTRHLGQDTTVSGCAGLLDAAMTRRHASPDDLAAARRCPSQRCAGQLCRAAQWSARSGSAATMLLL